MSNSDKEVLEEFEAWRADLVGNGKDLSVAAFLREREDEHNRLRIADALASLDYHISNFWDDPDERALTLLKNIRTILVGDREHVEDRTFDGSVVRRDYV